MAHIVQGHADPGKGHVVVSISDFQQWASVIDIAHQHSAWVACIDPSVDEQLLRKEESDDTSKRRSSVLVWVGSHRENNYTVSTEQFSLVDISKKIGVRSPGYLKFRRILPTV